jgi:hypothetical protein
MNVITMQQTYYKMASNKNWDIAYAWVNSNYPELAALPRSIRFLPASFKDGALGRYMDECVDDIRAGVRNPGHGFVQVYNGQRSAGDFVNTYVHELTHAAQHLNGRNRRVIGDYQAEGEAMQAGWLAKCRFEGK